MKILLLGEYSGLFNSLKEGLVELGHNVTLISDGDGFKNYPSDYSWRVSNFGSLNPYFSLLKGLSLFPKFTGFDIVYVVSPNIICGKPYFGPLLFNFLKRYNGKVFLCGAGMTAKIFKYWYDSKGTKYNKYVNGYADEVGGDINRFYLYSSKLLKDEMEILSIVDGYIPIMYEYAVPFLNHPKCCKTIPIPINPHKYDYSDNIVKDKIRIFHGKTKTCKGGEYILKAFENLSTKYTKEVEFITKGNIPFDKYIPYLRTMNIIVDDANAYSLGMNALFSMSMGRIVLGGAEELGDMNLGYSTKNPAFNIISDVKNISDTLENLITNRETLVEKGIQSRKFVEDEHDYIKIAQNYLEVWNS